METDTKVAAAKAGTAWAAVGITGWGDVASMCAAALSVLLILDLLWKRIGRPMCEALGWIKPRLSRRVVAETDNTPL